jgi:hypothetical protein
MTISAVWTIEVGGASRKYKNAKFERKLKKDSPTSFSAQIEYADPAVAYFDLVEIKRNGTIEWKGYVETIAIKWSNAGRFYNVSGRDTSLILWKKYNEEFQSYAEGIEGFFGKVKASELIQFLLRTPRSDLPSESDDYKYNKQGWGIDNSRIINVTAARTSYGDTKWTTLRKRSVAGWRNVGVPYALATKTVTSIISNTWSDATGASPYLDSDDDDTSFIESATVDQTAIFQLDNLAGATGINSVHLSVKWKPDKSWWFWVSSLCYVYVSRDAGATWFYVGSFGGKNAVTGSDPYFVFNYDVSNIFTSVSHLSGGNAQIKFVNKSSTLSTHLTYTCLSINYSSGGLQDVSDFLQMSFNEEDITGIYVESRADEESYPRNYEIVYLTDTLEDFSDFSETDPETHIALTDDDTTVLFDSFQDEDAYLYKDYGLNQIDAFDWKFSFEVTTPQDHNRCFCPFVVSQALNDLKALEDGADYFSALYVKCLSSVLTVYIENLDGGGTTTTSGHTITAGTEYFIRVVRSGTMLRYMCYSDSSLKSDYLLWTETITLSLSSIKYRYRMQACTYNGLEDKEDVIDASYAVDGWTDIHMDWTKIGGTICLDSDDDGDTSYIHVPLQTIYLGYYDEYYSFANLDAKYTSIDLTKVEIHLKGKHVSHTGGDVNVRIYIWNGGWVDCGTVTFTNTLTDQSISIITTLDTLAKLNNARLKVSLDAFGGNEDGSIRLSYAYLHIEGTAHYTEVTHTSGEIHTYYPIETTLVSAVTGNTYRDIVHSWSPVNIGNIRIKITGSDSHAWAVSQIYVYKAESIDYRIMHEDASTPSFALNQYIHAITVDDVYATAIGPLNISEGRVIDQINSIFDNLHTAYVPYEWYMEMVTNNTFHICDAKGSDKSGSITFVLGTNFTRVEREQTVENTFQRVKVRGNGEGARSDLASSGWVNDTTAMTTAKTFMEEINSQKEIASKDIADLLAEILLKENATPKDAIQCDVSKDTYASMAYDVGDSVKITDSLISVDAAKRIFNIMKSFDEDGEQVTLYLGAPYEDKETMLKEIFNRIKNLELGGGITGDWTDQAKPSMVSVTKINTLFEKTAKEENLVTGDDANDVKWEKTNIDVQGTAFACDDNGIAIQGATSGAQIISTVDYKWNTSSIETDDVEYILVPKQNPKIEFEFKAYDQVTGGVLSWKNGDFFDVGLAKDTATYITGAWFRFLSVGSGNIQVFSVSRDIGETSETAKYIATISTNTRYRFIIKYDYDRRWITWEMWDIVNKAVYPLVAVKTGISVSDTQSVHPLFMQLTSNYAAGYRAQAILYHTKIEFESVTYELGSDE